MACEAILALPDELIDRVVFFSRADAKSFPLCCEVHAHEVVFYAQQDDRQWLELVERLERLPGFMKDWFATISEPPFERLELVAFEREG